MRDAVLTAVEAVTYLDADFRGHFAANDVVLHDRATDPGETTNLADDPANRDLVATLSGRLETLISEEIGEDSRAWVTERPTLLGWPTWEGDKC